MTIHGILSAYDTPTSIFKSRFTYYHSYYGNYTTATAPSPFHLTTSSSFLHPLNLPLHPHNLPFPFIFSLLSSLSWALETIDVKKRERKKERKGKKKGWIQKRKHHLHHQHHQIYPQRCSDTRSQVCRIVSSTFQTLSRRMRRRSCWRRYALLFLSSFFFSGFLISFHHVWNLLLLSQNVHLQQKLLWSLISLHCSLREELRLQFQSISVMANSNDWQFLFTEIFNLP